MESRNPFEPPRPSVANPQPLAEDIGLSSRPGSCPTCGSRKIARSSGDPGHEAESHQCKSCGARLITTLPLREYLLVGAQGFGLFVLAIGILSVTGVLSNLSTLWQRFALLGLLVGTYLLCSFKIRRRINYELWLPVKSY